MENDPNSLFPIDLSIFKDHIRNSFFSIIDQIPKGPKLIVFDTPLISVMDFYFQVEILKEKEIAGLLPLSRNPLLHEIKTIVYFINPKISNLENISFQVQDHLKSKITKDYFVIFIPKLTYDCQQFIDNNKLKADLRLFNLPIDVFPLEKDVLSLEENETLNTLFVNNETTVLSQLSKVIIKFESIFGRIKYKYTKGEHAKTLKTLLESEEDITNFDTDDQILASVMIDRSVDFITPLCTQYTYEGMIDELVGIKLNFAKFPPKVFDRTESNKEKTKILNSEKDSLFDLIRDFNFNYVRSYLPNRLKEIQQLLEDKKKQDSIDQISSYLEKLKKNTEDFNLVSDHINIADYVSNLIKHPILTEYLKYEQNLLVGGGDIPTGLYEFYDNEISKQTEITKVLRIMCIESLVLNGMKKNSYDGIKKDFLHAYGFQEVFLLRNLEKLKILKKQEGKNQYDAVNNELVLIKEDVNISEPNDASYVFGGYCPITIRLLEALVNRGWKSIFETLKKLPGYFDFPENEREIIQPKTRPNFILVVFIGGVTYAEISAIRYLNRKSHYHKFIILTTHIINGKNMLNSLRNNIPLVLSNKEFYSQIKQITGEK